MVFKAELYENLDVKRQVTAIDSEVHELQYEFLNGSVVFKSDDGMYCGYGLATDPHKIIVLPLGEGKYEPMLPKVKDFVLERTENIDGTETLKESKKQAKKCASIFTILSLVSAIGALGMALFEVLMK